MAEMMCIGDIEEVFFVEVEFDKDLNELAGLGQKVVQLEPVKIKRSSEALSQRRVTFHLPDGSQESCSDSGLGDHEPVGSGALISHPLPLVQPQDEFYDQASPDKRTEADGNSDPNSASFIAIKAKVLKLVLDHLFCMWQ
ncbi:hypothetical protein G4228_017768 [Cervus hanglu yarkandensis]|nr:hypothetical protein G4228_017768 [Cervus hanglu yarkandensis]